MRSSLFEISSNKEPGCLCPALEEILVRRSSPVRPNHSRTSAWTQGTGGSDGSPG